MDFSSLRQKFGEFAKTATEKAKEIGDKALEFAGDNIAKTPLYIESSDEYDDVIALKKGVILAYDDRTEMKDEILKNLPIWQTKSFIESSTFRYLTASSSDILIREKAYSLPIEMRVFSEKKEILKLTNLEEIKDFWNLEFRDYHDEANLKKALEEYRKSKAENKDTKTDTKPEEENVDPLGENTELKKEKNSETEKVKETIKTEQEKNSEKDQETFDENKSEKNSVNSQMKDEKTEKTSEKILEKPRKNEEKTQDTIESKKTETEKKTKPADTEPEKTEK